MKQTSKICFVVKMFPDILHIRPVSLMPQIQKKSLSNKNVFVVRFMHGICTQNSEIYSNNKR